MTSKKTTKRSQTNKILATDPATRKTAPAVRGNLKIKTAVKAGKTNASCGQGTCA
jgi:hypothetical protein